MIDTDFLLNRLRVRVCGLCRRHDRLLLIRHRAIVGEGSFWATPGGGMEFGESAPDALKREFLEETGLLVTVGDLRFVYEYRALPLHSIELFFDVTVEETAEARLGTDPELQHQLMEELAWVSWEELAALPTSQKQAFLQRVHTWEELAALRGYVSKEIGSLPR